MYLSRVYHNNADHTQCISMQLPSYLSQIVVN